jgi:hypothetical protein
MSNINWKELSQQYKDRGFVVFPTVGKIPALHTSWSKIVDEWDNNEVITAPNQDGIALVCGAPSGVVALDIDVDDKQFIDSLPFSSISKRGKKGITYFFQYESYMHNFSFRGVVDFLCDRKYTILPPSRHPDGMNYAWKELSLLKADEEMIPVLSEANFNLIKAISESFFERNKKLSIVNTEGRNTKLKDMACAALFKNSSELSYSALINKVSEEIFEYDHKNHPKPLFWDADERKFASNSVDALSNAKQFTLNCLRSISSKIVENEALIPMVKFTDIKNDKFEIKNYPKPTGLLGEIYDYLLESSYVKTPNMAFGGAIATLATSIGKSLKLDDCKCNNYYLFVANAGGGKSSVIESMAEILDQKRIDSADYLSSQGVIASLKDGCENIALNDEISQLFKLIKDGSEWQKRIPQVLTTLWSVSDKKFLLPKISSTKKKEDDSDDKINFIEKPFVNIVGATTFSELKESVDKSFFSSGLFPRFLIFIDKEDRNSHVVRLNHDEIEKKQSAIIHLLRQLEDGLAAKLGKYAFGVPEAISFNLTDDANKSIDSLSELILDRQYSDVSESVKLIYGRGIQHIKKLALIHAVSSGNADINEKDIAWAYDVFTISLHNASNLISEVSTENKVHRTLERVFNIIKESGNIKKKDLSRRTNFIKGAERESIIKDLLDSERIVKIIDNIKGQPSIVYTVNNGANLNESLTQ